MSSHPPPPRRRSIASPPPLQAALDEVCVQHAPCASLRLVSSQWKAYADSRLRRISGRRRWLPTEAPPDPAGELAAVRRLLASTTGVQELALFGAGLLRDEDVSTILQASIPQTSMTASGCVPWWHLARVPPTRPVRCYVLQPLQQLRRLHVEVTSEPRPSGPRPVDHHPMLLRSTLCDPYATLLEQLPRIEAATRLSVMETAVTLRTYVGYLGDTADLSNMPHIAALSPFHAFQNSKCTLCFRAEYWPASL